MFNKDHLTKFQEKYNAFVDKEGEIVYIPPIETNRVLTAAISVRIENYSIEVTIMSLNKKKNQKLNIPYAMVKPIWELLTMVVDSPEYDESGAPRNDVTDRIDAFLHTLMNQGNKKPGANS